MARRERPLSPHLQVYRWQLHMATSIFHRASGVALAVGSIFLTWWLVAAATGPGYFDMVQGYVATPAGRLVLTGFTWALFYHLLNGLRHLNWDLGRGFKKEQFKRSGMLVITLSMVLTVVVWLLAYRNLGLI